MTECGGKKLLAYHNLNDNGSRDKMRAACFHAVTCYFCSLSIVLSRSNYVFSVENLYYHSSMVAQHAMSAYTRISFISLKWSCCLSQIA